MGITYTPEQQEVIDIRGSNVLVSAAAGSGKTAVLTERIVKMISDERKPIDIDRLLVVTFTNAAAAEMRERISAAIARRLEAEPENGHLQKQATLVHNAQITTIDSFCMFVIRNNFNDIGLDPGFRVADEGELRLLKQDVMKALLEEKFAKKDENFLHCVEYFSTGNRDDAIEGHILKLYQFAESNPWPEEWLEERKGDYGIETLEELDRAEFIRFGMEQAALMAKDCLLKMEECIKICEQPDGPYMYGEVLEAEAQGLRKLASAKRYGEGYALFHGMAFGRLPSKKDSSVSTAKREMIQECRKGIKDTVKNICGKFFPAPPETVLEYMKGSGGAVRTLVDLTLAFKDALDRKKREENIIDFSDMEHLALSILVKRRDTGEGDCKGQKKYEPSRTALDYRDYFEEILIDEYQDSNSVQEMLLESISGEADGKFNRFMVGDVKQSIYKFRLARPEIFMEKFEEYGKGGENGEKNRENGGSEGNGSNGGNGGNGGKKKRIDLHKNFRSRREVLDSVNFIFSRIMGKRLGGVEYDEEAALYQGAEYAVQTEEGGGSPNRTELLLIQKAVEDASGEEQENGGGMGNVDGVGTVDGWGGMPRTETVRAEMPGIGMPRAEMSGTEMPRAEMLGAGMLGTKMSGAEMPGTEMLGTGIPGVGMLGEKLPRAEERKLSDKQREAYAVSKRIKELVGHFLVTDKESGELRKASYKDIVILLRTNAGWDEDFKSILKEEGIPSHVLSKTGYFAAKEIRVLLQLLRILDNPNQDIPLFGVLKSCFGNFTDEEIAEIRGHGENRKKRLYFCLKEWGRGDGTADGMCGSGGMETVNKGEDAEAREGERKGEQKEEQKGEQKGGQEDSLKEKIRAFLRFVEEYRDKIVYMPIHELLQDILVQTGYLNYVSALPGGGQRRANVQMLLEKAVAFEQTSYYGLFHFIRYMEQLEKYDVDYGEANILDENADVVRIMSIHKSKGLEFPICFVCGLAKKFNMQDINGKMIADVDMGIGVDYVDVEHRLQGKTVRKNIIGEKMRLDNLGEELRILYVALTRAKEKLIMTGMIDRPEKKLSMLILSAMRGERQLMYGELAKSGSCLDFLLPALSVHKAFEPLWQRYGLEVPKRKNVDWEDWNAQMEIKIIGDEDFLGAEIKEQLFAEGSRKKLECSNPLTDTDSELMTKMSDIFSHPYIHSNLADLYTKTTVSELKKAGQEEEKDFSFRLYEEETVIPYIPKFMREEESLGGAGRGSAFHKAMELMDFGEGAGSVEEQIGRMERDGMLSPEYVEALSLPAIQDFLSTDLARRMAVAEGLGCLYREQPFVLGLPATELNGKFPSGELVLIQGIIDVYFEEDGEIVVADYKTDRVDTGRELVEKYRKQLEYYARALEQLTGKRVKEKIIYSFRLHKEIMI